VTGDAEITRPSASRVLAMSSSSVPMKGSLAVGVVALAAPLDDVDVIGLVGHDGSVLRVDRTRSRKVYRRRR
jgi:hypothetical protein